ncbi:class I SAM-dependent methyltransferase [Streptomyces sp. PSAA01]|uniref:methyltransferase n=1 Tax=Streptomyces sp. PSAA01 TaxID=2912762 RepID=UPI001F419485|nr:class I SAM-dependent methyltransferase [Streptomyces sp. PSAA01]MCG0286181.1 methyltransferase [Streptomyces sp. PSAA01]
MSQNASAGRNLADEITASGPAADIAGAAALFEIGESLGVIEVMTSSDVFTTADLAKAADLPEDAASRYLEALDAAGLIVRNGHSAEKFRKSDDFMVTLHRAGYISWTQNANRPFIQHAREFLIDPESARAKYHRDGRAVAVSSEWMGSRAFYPAAYEAILTAKPKRMVDLGAGTCRLLVNLLQTFPESTAVGLDIDHAACEAAKLAAEAAGVADRLTVFERPIQSVADDATPVQGADLVHAGFVFHDMMPEEEEIADRVLANCREAMPEGGLMAITEAIPYARSERERRFSAIVTYYHQQFMGRKLLNEAAWTEKLLAAGFRKVEVVELGFPTGRLFLAAK